MRIPRYCFSLLLLALPAAAQDGFYQFQVNQDALAGAADFSVF